MSNYYIKYITGPGGRSGYPENSGNLVHFASGQDKPCNHFKECDGFFLYETGHRDKRTKETGAKAIYARGVIDADQTSFLGRSGFGTGEPWPYAAKVILEKRIDPPGGVSLKKIEKIVGKKLRNKRGGLWKITAEQFREIDAELEKCL